METGSVPAVCWRRGGVAPWSCAVQLMERNSINRVLVTGRSVNKLLTSLKDVWKMALELWRSPRGGDGALDACGLTSLAQTYAWPAALGSFATSRIPMDAVAASALVVAGYPWHLALTTRDCWDLACMHSSMASCVRCNDWPYALELFDALGTGCLGLRSPNIISYNSLLRSEPTWSSALRVFQEVAEVGLRRSSFTWTSTLASVPWREAMQVRTQMAQETNEPPHISGFTHVQPWREAVRALDESRDRFGLRRDLVALGALTANCAEAAAWRETLQLTLQGPNSMVVLGSAVSACEKWGHWRRALQLLALPADMISFGAAQGACAKAERRKAVGARCWRSLAVRSETSSEWSEIGGAAP